MSTLAQCLREERWEVAAYLLLIGLVKAARRLPPGALEDLLAWLEGETPSARGGG